MQEPTQVTSCCNLLKPVHQLSFSSQNARILFHKCNECSLSNTTWHLIIAYLARMSLEIHLPILLCQTNWQYLVWWTVSVIEEECRIETIPVDLGVKWWQFGRYPLNFVMLWTFPTLNIRLFFVFRFQCNWYFDKQNMHQEWVALIFQSPCFFT
jgi:hypothetical protein